MTLNEVYSLAEKKHIDIDEFRFDAITAMSLPEGCIAYDPRKFETQSELKAALAHEIGHIDSGAFYSDRTPFETRARCEYKADKRAAQMLIPIAQLRYALKHGYTEAWQLAELFDVPERFIKRALLIYDVSA